MKAYQAYGKAGRVTRDTARAAAVAYFEAFPTSRKCDVIAGHDDGEFFRVYYAGRAPESYRGITKKTAVGLPE